MAELVRKATRRIVLIDNYIDDTVLLLFCFVPKILAMIPAVAGIKPIWILVGGSTLAVPFIAYQAFRERNAFTHLALVAALGGLLLIFSADFIFNNVLQDHQRKRIEVLLGMKEDPAGVGYNVNQSKIAIGSGGFFGKGYLNGTQTTYGFVPEQSTDFIFCTIGEEWGFTAMLFIFIALNRNERKYF